jgi:hypothetical protein
MHVRSFGIVGPVVTSSLNYKQSYLYWIRTEVFYYVSEIMDTVTVRNKILRGLSTHRVEAGRWV